jgi:hypothetical protein
MAKTVTLTDDFTGKPSTETDPVTTRKIVVDGTVYEIDLTGASLAAFAKAADPFLSKARKSEAKPEGEAAKARAWATDTDAGKAWAKGNPTVTISQRGRIDAKVIDAWKLAGSPDAKPDAKADDKATPKAA